MSESYAEGVSAQNDTARQAALAAKHTQRNIEQFLSLFASRKPWSSMVRSPDHDVRQ
jgi:hypothetical protein